MAESNDFQFERLYVGVLVDSNKHTSASPGVLARTANVTAEHVAECLRVGRLSAPGPRESTDEMPGALGLFRGEQTDFILVKAQRNDAGLAQLLYIMLPASALRALGGNVLAFRQLALMEMPSFRVVKHNLQPFTLPQSEAPNAEEQARSLNDLLLYCQDSFTNVEGILAGLVQGKPIAITNSPPDVEKRLKFVQGLLSFLPVPARVGITFATQVQDPAAVPAQIKFLSGEATPADHLIYDWGNGKLCTDPPEDSYSHYMIAQLRLDTELVVQQTVELSRTAVWRARHRENLGRALGWVSRRAAIDRAVGNNQPADPETVAAILREDPTLSDEMRVAYTRHLLAFSLALDSLQTVDAVPTVCVSNDAVARSVVDYVQNMMENGQARIVFFLLERWLLRIPEASALGWHRLLHQAARHHLDELLAEDNDTQALEFLEYVQTMQPALRMHETTPHLVRTALPRARGNERLARAIYLMAVESMPAGDLYRLLNVKEFRTQLPAPLRTALTYLQTEPRHPAPPQVLDKGARAFGDGHRMLVLARLVEWAMYLRRPELVDTAALQALLVMAQSHQAARFIPLIEQVLEEFSQISIIQVLAPPGPRILVQLLLQIGDYEGAMDQLEFYQNTVYGLNRLKEFTQVAKDVFRFTPLKHDGITAALEYLEGSQIRPEPRAMIYVGALVNCEWQEDQDYAARRLTTMIFNDNHLIGTVGPEFVLKLLEYHARARSALDTLRVAAALIDYTQNMETEGAVLIVRMWPSISWSDDVTEAAHELLRRFLRSAPEREVPTLIAYFEDELGTEIGHALQATALMREMMGPVDLMELAQEIQLAAAMFTDVAAVYHTDKEIPPVHRLKRDLDSMTGGLSEQDRNQVADNLHNIMRQVFELGRDRARKRGRTTTDEQVVEGKVMPQSGLELLLFMGGHFVRPLHRLLPLDLTRESMAHVFGDRSAAMFLRETSAVTRLLGSLQATFPENSTHEMTPEALRSEIDSLWNSLSLYNQRRIQEDLATDCQQLAQVIALIADEGNERILADSGQGRQLENGTRQPRKALEALRWIQGYFARKHRR